MRDDLAPVRDQLHRVENGMFPFYKHQHHSRYHPSELEGQSSTGFLSAWWRSAVRNWKRRRMIAELNRLDDWILQDIGIVRGQIPRLVESFCDRELDMAPIARAKQPSMVHEDDLPATIRYPEKQHEDIGRLAA